MAPRLRTTLKKLLLAVALFFAPCVSQAQPNVLVVMVDDLSVNEYDAALANNVWPAIKQHVVGAGTKFTNAFFSTALCSPTRATLLTGQHSHNHGVLDNRLPLGGATKIDDASTLPVWLQAAGYRTGLVGKYLNGYGLDLDSSPKDDPTYIPPGWNDFQALMTYGMYGYKLTDNGVIVTYGSAPPDYQTDVLKGRALNFIAESEAHDSQPWFLLVTPFAPHLEPGVVGPGCSGSKAYKETIRAAPRHIGTLPQSVKLVHGPAFNEANMSDKPTFLQSLPLLTTQDIQCSESFWRSRLEAMEAVDDLVGALVSDLQQKGELSNTAIIFTSDNGYFWGEHRLSKKLVGYEEAMRAPLAIRAPGYPAGQVSSRFVLSTDLSPTIVQLADGTNGIPPDGRSLVPLLANPSAPWRMRVFGEYLGTWTEIDGNTFYMVRTGPGDATAPNDSYILWANSAKEYYDLDGDPYQLKSQHKPHGTEEERIYLGNLIDEFKTCAGSSCASIEDAP
jgi:N-acetylglucosamine-6-sulfatase